MIDTLDLQNALYPYQNPLDSGGSSNSSVMAPKVGASTDLAPVAGGPSDDLNS